MIRLQYFNATKWETIGEFSNSDIAWITLGDDNYNYRTIDENGKVIKENTEWDFK